MASKFLDYLTESLLKVEVVGMVMGYGHELELSMMVLLPHCFALKDYFPHLAQSLHFLNLGLLTVLDHCLDHQSTYVPWLWLQL